MTQRFHVLKDGKVVPGSEDLFELYLYDFSSKHMVTLEDARKLVAKNLQDLDLDIDFDKATNN